MKSVLCLVERLKETFCEEFSVDAGVAQLVEQRTCNAQVAGSSPFASSRAGQDRDKTEVTESGELPEWLKGAGCKPAGAAYGGSNPSLPTMRFYGSYARLYSIEATRSLMKRPIEGPFRGGFHPL